MIPHSWQSARLCCSKKEPKDVELGHRLQESQSHHQRAIPSDTLLSGKGHAW